MNADEYLSVLNDEQKQAVIHEGSPLLILAGAGSGKTRVITTKIAYMISQKNVRPESILAVTFTKKAAEEMRERAVALEEKSRYAQIRTFHSFGAFFLRAFGEEIGLEQNFTVYDEDDSAALIAKAVPSLLKKEAAAYAKKISLAKDYCILPQDENIFEIDGDPFFAEVYAKYQERLRSTGNVDFGDLILLPYLILKKNEILRHRMHQKFRAILVDEYQDSNVAQFNLLRELSGVKENSGSYICVVGDDDQSIYKFRGAEVKNILNFQDEFPGTKIVRLETNYRSTAEILECAENVVKNNSGRLGKHLVSFRGKGKKPTAVFLPTQDDETEFCSSMIQQSYEKGIPYGDWAILYRTNAQSMGFETKFLRESIPYAVVGSLKFYEREEIKDAVAWLSFVANKRDEISFRRIVNKPVRGIGSTTQDKILQASAGAEIPSVFSSMKFSKKTQEGILKFDALVKKFSAMLPETSENPRNDFLAEQAIFETAEKKNSAEENLAGFLQTVIRESGLEEFHMEQDKNDGSQKIENLDELVNSAVIFPRTKQGLLDFLDHVNLDRTLNTENENAGDDRVTLITLHNTKGLEFNRVIITGMEGGIFPRDGKSADEMEEERRLFYVGITRAKNDLYFTSCSLRRIFGSTRPMMPSVFLSELGKNSVRILGDNPSENFFEKNPLEEKFFRGARIFHDEYGYGFVTKSFYNAEKEFVVEVNFDNAGKKRFLPEYMKNSLIVTEGDS
jgi:DNA helicase-2/ATP-dependent DNA helicase PcrA